MGRAGGARGPVGRNAQQLHHLGPRPSASLTIGSAKATIRGLVGWRHAFGDVTPTQTVAFQGGPDFGDPGRADRPRRWAWPTRPRPAGGLLRTFSIHLRRPVQRPGGRPERPGTVHFPVLIMRDGTQLRHAVGLALRPSGGWLGRPAGVAGAVLRCSREAEEPLVDQGLLSIRPIAGKEWRGWDSNPRYPCGYSAFRVRRVRPLCHLSAGLWRGFATPSGRKRGKLAPRGRVSATGSVKGFSRPRSGRANRPSRACGTAGRGRGPVGRSRRAGSGCAHSDRACRPRLPISRSAGVHAVLRAAVEGSVGVAAGIGGVAADGAGCGIVSPGNAASVRLLEKLGLRREGEYVIAAEREPLAYYAISF